METDILKYFSEFLEKQDMLCKLTENQKLHSYGYSEIHTLKAVHDLPQPNVTSIAEHLRLTKGAVSKITKKLVSSKLIDTYRLADNNQKLFFSLTEKGEKLYEEHEKRHSLWRERDNKFLSSFPEQELQQIVLFMEQYNQYLEEQIAELSRKD